jgi:cell wall-associated NlpC family hydrolase
VKKYLYLFGLLVFLTSCASTRPKSYPGSSSVPPPEKVERDPQYLENISINNTNKEETTIHKPATIESPKTVSGGFSSDIEKCNYLQFKYAILLEESVESMTNERLIAFLENWYGTPYQFGGDTKTGIDCSAFTCLLMDSVFNITLPRTAKNQYNSSQKIRREDLNQGDLVFFNTTGGISHVGVYLANNKFVHAATSSGVMISDLDEAYFKRRYVGATRVR